MRTLDSMTSPDLLVVGAGTAGLVAAHTAATLGADVLLVERHRFGGDCLWTGCVPSKALLAAAAAAADARDAARLGVHAEVRVDVPAVLAHVRAAMATIEPEDAPEALHAAGVRTAAGDVTLTGARTATLDGRSLDFDTAVLATGSYPAIPDLPGLADVAPLTSDDLWDLEDLPASMAVLGGGSIGCELAQALARLGVQVTVMESADRVLPGEDPLASAVIAAALEHDGVQLRTGAKVTAVARTSEGCRIEVAGGPVRAQRLLVAVGRRPRTEGLGLAAAGVDVDGGHIVVDEALQTTNPRIWAAGDVTGGPQFTHLAGQQGGLAATNAVLGLRRPIDLSGVPRVTYTSPEVAAVGAPTAEGGPLRVLHRADRSNDRAIAEGRTDGFVRLAVDRRHRVRGGTIVSPRAGEVLIEVTAAVRSGTTTSALAGVVHPIRPGATRSGMPRSRMRRPGSPAGRSGR